jgi:sugar (pentulose or hexulose) kinase
MSTVTWIKDLMGSDLITVAKSRNLTPEAYLNELGAAVPVGSDGLYTVLHWLARPKHPHERGMMVGFNGKHKGPHMFRSVLEGIAFTMKNHAQAMCDERGIDMTALIISGGGSNGDLFMQIFADVFGLPARRNVVNGSASMGAAICTALALGIYRDRQQAIDHMVRPRDTFKPVDKHVALYERMNRDVYSKLAPTLDPLLATSHGIFNS